MQRRRQPLAVTSVAALAVLAMTGCVGPSDTTQVHGDVGSELAPTATELIPPPEAPGVGAALVVDALPDGWHYSHEFHPKMASGNPMVIIMYQGAPVDLEIPGGGQAYQSISVNASWVPGLGELATWGHVTPLVSPDGKQIDTREVKVGARPALLLTRDSIPQPPGRGHALMAHAYTIVFTIGEWRVELNGEEVAAETLLAVAQGVDVR